MKISIIGAGAMGGAMVEAVKSSLSLGSKLTSCIRYLEYSSS